MSAWIEMISDEQADEQLKPHLEAARSPSGIVDNVMRVHSLRPHTMEGHYVLYRSVLHNAGNTLDDATLETLASYVSILNGCDYSLTNHFANARHCIGDDTRADAVYAALKADQPEQAFEGRELAMLRYARRLTVEPANVQQADIQAMRDAGLSDGEILEVNQVCGYFAYANRTLNGLGVTLDGDIIGYYGHTEAAEAST